MDREKTVTIVGDNAVYFANYCESDATSLKPVDLIEDGHRRVASIEEDVFLWSSHGKGRGKLRISSYDLELDRDKTTGIACKEFPAFKGTSHVYSQVHNKIFLGSRKNFIRVLEVPSLKEEKIIHTNEIFEKPSRVAVLNHLHLGVGGKGSFGIVDIERGKMTQSVFNEDEKKRTGQVGRSYDSAKNIKYDPDRGLIYVCFKWKSVCVFDYARMNFSKPVNIIENQRDRNIRGLALLPHKQQIVIGEWWGDRSDESHSFDVRTFRLLQSWSSGSITRFCLLPENQFLTCSSFQGTLYLRDRETKKVKNTIEFQDERVYDVLYLGHSSFVDRSRFRNFFMLTKKSIIQVLREELEERIEFAKKEFSDFEISFSSSSMKLWEFVFSKEERTKAKSLKKFDVKRVTERKLIDFILFPNLEEDWKDTWKRSDRFLTKKLKSEDDLYDRAAELIEYFKFFKILGMKREMAFVLRKFENEVFVLGHEESVKEQIIRVYRTLKSSVCDAILPEEKEVQELLFSNPDDEEEKKEVQLRDHFCFAHSVNDNMFRFLSTKNDIIRKDMKIYHERGISETFLQFLNKKDVFVKSKKQKDGVVSFLSHTGDFEKFDIAELGGKKKLRNLYKTKNENGNVELRVKMKNEEEERKIIMAHREILCIQSNFFSRMMRFSGSEAEQLKATGVIDIEFLEYECLLYYVQFLYLSDLSVIGEDEEGILKDVEKMIDCMVILMKLLLHSEMYQEIELMRETCSKLEEILKNHKKKIEDRKRTKKDEKEKSTEMSPLFIPIEIIVKKLINHKELIQFFDNERMVEFVLPLFSRFVKKTKIEQMISKQENTE